MHLKQFCLILFLSTVIFIGCKGVEKQSAAQETPKQVREPIEKDFYFSETVEIESKNGPNNITRNIMQDQNGNMWFASWEGIMQYNGDVFTNITNKEELRRYRAFSLLEDSKKNLWFGTIGAGIFKYDQFSYTNLSKKNGLVNDDVGCIYEDRNGLLWFGTRVGLSSFDGKEFTNYSTEDGLSDNDINAIVEDAENTLWIGARGYASKFDGIEFERIERKDGTAFTNVRSIIRDDKGNMWLGGNDGLWVYDGVTFKQILEEFVGNIFQDSRGNIWISRSAGSRSYSMSLYKIEALPLLSQDYSIQLIHKENGQVFGITEDSDKKIWFGTERGACIYEDGLVSCFNN